MFPSRRNTRRKAHGKRNRARMLAVIWVMMLCVMGGAQSEGSHAGGAAQKSHENYFDGWSITFGEDLVTSEAGLCAVIPCSFTHHDHFKPTSATWLKCESSKRKCNDRDVVFHSKSAAKAQVPFRGRVALLEPNIARRNCSIAINDLQESDTGSYQFRVEGHQNGQTDGYRFGLKNLLTVTGLRQKPRVNVPPAMTEGQRTTLTCTAPGLCFGTPPDITWTWTKTGHHVPHIANNVTILTTENLTSVSQRHSSMLTFTPSPEHDGSEVTCQVTFKGNITAAETVTLNVTYLKMPSISGETTVEEGGTLNVTCDAESSPASTVTWTLLDYNIGLMEDTQRASLVIPMVTRVHSGRYSCTAQHLNKTLTTFTDISVMTFPKILGGSECTLQSETLTCVCVSQGVPLPTITWPLLKDRSVYSVTITVLNSTINSTVSLAAEDHDNTSVRCFSTNYMKTVNKTLIVVKKDEGEDEVSISAAVKFIVVALMCVAFSIYCLASTFNRCRGKNTTAELSSSV